MKTSTLVAVVVALIIIVGGGWYWWTYMQQAPYSNPTGGTTTGAPVANVGEHCGGNMANAPVCAEGSTCAPTPGSNLPFGDVGGTCVADSTSTSSYVSGNLLLGVDSNATLGTYLIASNAMTLYHTNKDSAGVSTCTGQCAAIWPPYVIDSTDALANIQAGIGGKVGSITRADGSMQVTYNGMPLYFYSKDNVSGDTMGQGVGGVWSVVTP